MIRFLGWLHGWVGLFFGLVFAFLFFTGAVLMVENMIHQYERSVHMPTPRLELTPEKIATDLDAIVERKAAVGLAISSIRTPLDQEPAYRVAEGRRAGQVWYMASDDLAPLAVPESSILDNEVIQAVLVAFTDWHVSLIDGTRWGGVVAIVGTVLGIVGLIIFWPWRRAFNWRNWSWPSNWNRAGLMSNHLTAGMLSFAFLLIFGITGAFLEYRREIGAYLAPIEELRAAERQAEVLAGLNARYVDLTPEASRPSATRSPAVDALTHQAQVSHLMAATTSTLSTDELAADGSKPLAQPQKLPLSVLALRAMDAIPGVIITDVTGYSGDQVTFRMRKAGDAVQPLGRTYVALDTWSGEFTRFEPADDRLWLRKLTQVSAPLHMGGGMSMLYQGLSVFGSLLVTLICITGSVSFVRRRLRRKPAQA